jgi:hypothetical protein
MRSREIVRSLAVASLVGCPAVWADTVTLQNDSLPPQGGQTTVQAGFAAHEIGGAVFTLPANYRPFTITAVQILWRSFTGGQPDRLEQAIHFYTGGTANPPNLTHIAQLNGPQLSDGFLNQFDVSPLNLVINTTSFAVGLEFGDLEPRDVFSPSLCTDRDGCQAMKNFAIVNGGTVTNGCSLGISGDFIIRVVGETPTVPPEVSLRAGNVDTGNGNPPASVLTVNGSPGDPLRREMTIAQGAATVGLAMPPAGGNGLYAWWVFNGVPTSSTLQNAFLFNGAGGVESLGTACFCLPSNNQVSPGACPCPLAFPRGFTSKAILGAGGAANVCLHAAPADPRPPTTRMINLTPGDYSVAGIIFDPNSSSAGPRKVSLTNVVVVHVTP